jgi:hypothetical protein
MLHQAEQMTFPATDQSLPNSFKYPDFAVCCHAAAKINNQRAKYHDHL